MGNITDRELPGWAYRVVLLAAAVIWGLGFVIGKGAIAEIGAAWFTAVRFLGAGVVLGILLFGHLKRHLNKELVKAGIVIGVFSFLGFFSQFVGLSMTTPSKNAFLSACYCLTVPFILWVITRRRPSKPIFIAAVVCAVGIALVSLTDGFDIGLGDSVSVLSAFLYGGEIVAIGFFMRGHDVLTITVVQQFTSGFLALALACATHAAPTVAQLADPSLAGALAYVVLGSAAFGAIAQNLAQSHLAASEAGLLCSTESVFCAVFSALIIGEAFTAKMIAGFVLIFGSIIVAQLDSREV